MKYTSTLFLKLSLLLILTSYFPLSMWAKTYEYTFESKQFSANETKTLDSVKWALSGDGGYWGYESTKGQQFGSAKKPYKKMTLTTSDIPGTINSITINTSGASDIQGSFTISVGNSNYGTHKLTDSATSYKYAGSSSGEIKIEYTQTSSKAIYIKSITIEYTTALCTEPDISFLSSSITKTINDEKFTNTLTTNSSGDVTYTSSNTNIATIDNNGEVTIQGIGTTTITANITADATYCEASTEYTLTIKGREFNIKWINGEETHTKTHNEGETLTLPTNNPNSCSNNYTNFEGWYSSPAGTTSNPTTNLNGTRAQETTITNDTSFYAVFSNIKKNIVSLTKQKIIDNFTFDKCNYDTEEIYYDTENQITWTSYGYADNNNRPWIQYNKDTTTYLQVTTQQPIKKIILTITSAENTSGGITDITQHSPYAEDANIKIINTTNNDTIISVFGSDVKNNILEIDLSNNTSNTIKILPLKKACRIWNIDLFFSTKTATPAYISICDNLDTIINSNDKLSISKEIEINSITIKSNLDEVGQIAITNGFISANQVILEKTIDDQRYFFFSLPFNCNIADIIATDTDGNTLEYAPDASTGDFVINYYDQTRSVETGKAWKELLGTEHTLNANQGYIIGHFGSGNAIIKFPSTEKQIISAPTNKTLDYTSSWCTSEGTQNSTNGWNLIGFPYYQKANSYLTPELVTIPNSDGKTYTQTTYTNANISPFSSFFVQVTEAPEFAISTPQNAAPILRNNNIVNSAIITITDTNGGIDKTTIINNPSNTNKYEIGHDLTKWIGYASIPQIYTIQGNDILAFNSLSIDNSTIIPIGVYAHSDCEYTFSIDQQSIGDIHSWELYDNETGKATILATKVLS